MAVSGAELWKSNGTAAGTVMVTDIDLAETVPHRKLINVASTLYFGATRRLALNCGSRMGPLPER